MGKIKLCPRCNGKMVAISERTGGFSGKKAAAGALITGIPEVGLAAGASGKKLVTLRCEKCGYTIETDAKTAERAEWYGDVYGPAVELTTRMARESYENQRKLEILDRQLKNVLRKRLMPAKELSSGPILTEEERKAQRRQNSVIAICGEAAAAVCEDGTVVLAGNISDNIRNEVNNWKNIISVCMNEKSIYGLCADGSVVCAGQGVSDNEIKTWSGIIELCCDEGHVLGLKADGTVAAAGNNGKGQCDVSEWEDVVEIYTKGGASLCAYSLGLTSRGELLTAGKTRMEISDDSSYKWGYDSVYGELTVDGMFGVATFDGLFGKELFDRWGNLVDISCYGSLQSSIYGLREDGAVYGADNSMLFENARAELEESNDIVAVSVGHIAVSFLRKDGTVLTSKSAAKDKNGDGVPFYPPERLETAGWEEIVAVAEGGSVRLGLQTDGTVVTGGENGSEYAPLYNEVKTWKNIKVIPEVKERVIRLAQETRKRKEEERKIEEEKRKQQEEEQRKLWIAEGRCQYCGGKFSFFGKTCKNCGRKKDY